MISLILYAANANSFGVRPAIDDCLGGRPRYGFMVFSVPHVPAFIRVSHHLALAPCCHITLRGLRRRKQSHEEHRVANGMVPNGYIYIFSLSIYIYIDLYVYLYIYIYIHTSIYSYHIYIHIHIHIYTYVYILIYIYVYVYTIHGPIILLLIAYLL